MSKNAICYTVILICLFTAACLAKYSGGTGEPNDPYLIATPNDLNAIGTDPNDWDKHFKMTTDINLAQLTVTQLNTIGDSEKPFTGVFDGSGRTISNFRYDDTQARYVGLFGIVREPGTTISNLGIIDPNIRARYSVGGLAGYIYSGVIIKNCWVEGGIIHAAYGPAGGLVGTNYGSIQGCCTLGTQVSGRGYIGGLVASNSGYIEDCYAQSSVSVETENNAGGLVGRNWHLISRCYSAGPVNNLPISGGLTGLESSGIINASFWDVDTSTLTVSAGGKGLTTSEMHSAGTYVGWASCGTTSVWSIDDGNDYPRFVWQGYPGLPLPTETLSDYLDGSGTAGDPYLISSVDDFVKVGIFTCDWDKQFKLTSDITLKGQCDVDYFHIGYGGRPFSGVFDGNAHTISNFQTHYSSMSGSLFISVEGPNTIIKKLGILDPNSTSRGGVLAGSVGQARIEQCFVEGGKIAGSDGVGGLIGILNSGTVLYCYANTAVIGSQRTGGLIGWARGHVKHCWSAGAVTGGGGIFGEGGSKSSSCYYDSEKSGQKGGLGPRTTAQMYKANTYIGWCLEPGIWMIDEGCDYPRLAWENKPGQPWGEPSYSGGSGEPNDPYLIAGANDLQWIGADPCHWSRHFKMVADCDMKGFAGNVIGNYELPFTGKFDGNNHSIYDYNYLGYSHSSRIGLFGETSDTALIKNVRLVRPVMELGLSHFGMLVGELHGTLSNCMVIDGYMDTGVYTGGLAGQNYGSISDCNFHGYIDSCCISGGVTGINNGIISRCNVEATVLGSSTSSYCGGITARDYGSVSHCNFVGDVNGIDYVGGLIGRTYSGFYIHDCSVDANVYGEDYVGGIVGHNVKMVDNCHFTGSVEAKWQVGGLVGWAESCDFQNCSSKCNVTILDDDFAGGLVGNSRYCNYYACRADCNVSCETYGGGLLGYSYHCSLEQCSADANVFCEKYGGGLLGSSHYSDVEQCFSSGSVDANYGGGLTGSQSGRISNCYSTSNVTGDRIGGLIGSLSYSAILDNCYSTGVVSGNIEVGGLLGYYSGSSVKNCFWDVNTSGISTSAGGEGKTTKQMKTVETFLPWICEPVWTIDTNDYPRLGWENLPGKQLSISYWIDGSGTAADPYLIPDADHFQILAFMPCHFYNHYKLTADIDLDGRLWIPIGNSDVSFTGFFDGNEHRVFNLTIDANSGNYWGLFGRVTGNATIDNVGLIDPNISAPVSTYVGALAGYFCGATINSCYVSGGSVAGWNSVGGLTGCNCGYITGCYANTQVNGSSVVGGLIGYNYGQIWSSYALSDVQGDSKVGGLTGRNTGEIFNSYAAAQVTCSQNCGGLVGYSTTEAVVRSSYWDTSVSDQNSSAGGTPATTDQLQDPATFVSWGCDGIWALDPGYGYPNLIWENKPGELITEPSYAGGSGTEQDPYLISSVEQFAEFTMAYCQWDKSFILTTDIHLSDSNTEFYPVGFDDVPFTGIFDGNGHEIFDFHYPPDETGPIPPIPPPTGGGLPESIGLFREIDDHNAQIKNLGLVEPSIAVKYRNRVGCLIGFLNKGQVSDCYVEDGEVEGYEDVGLLAGFALDALVEDCRVTGRANGYDSVGGLVGWFGYRRGFPEPSLAELINSSADCNVVGINTAGGLVGTANCYLSRCFSSGSAAGDKVGGLTGVTGPIVFSYEPPANRIHNCYSKSIVFGGTYAGGLIGSDHVGAENCYTTGQVTGMNYVGAFVGTPYSYPSGYSGCFWDVNSNPSLSGTGYEYDPCDIIGETKENMRLASTYINAGWDFVSETVNGTNDIWDICNGTNYPKLSWQVPIQGDFLCPDGVDFIDYAVLADQWYLERLEQDIVPEGGDGIVNLLDWVDLAADWQGSVDFPTIADFFDNWLKQRPTIADITPPGGDDFVDWLDLRKLCENWLVGK